MDIKLVSIDDEEDGVCPGTRSDTAVPGWNTDCLHVHDLSLTMHLAEAVHTYSHKNLWIRIFIPSLSSIVAKSSEKEEGS
jgi:hypothetical protein